MHRVLALHGQTLSGAHMRRELAYLDKLGIELVCPDAPHAAPDALVERLSALMGGPREPPPYGAWWDASDDGRTYRGWEATRDLIAPMLEQRGPVAIIGFSQGAILATMLAALAQHGQLPPIDRMVLIAGRTPRADAITPFLVEPIRTRSLHIWGETDTLVGDTSRQLVELYDAATRQVATWPGSHAIPTQGAAARAIEQFITHR